MNLHQKQYLGIEREFTAWQTSSVAILPFPYEGGISYGSGTARAPESILEASAYLELYDEVIKAEPYRIGISTLESPAIPSLHEEMFDTIRAATTAIIQENKFPIVIGGDHSISSGFFLALEKRYKELGVVQIDAHADLRDSYEGSKFSHASVMARIRELTSQVVQTGIRSLSVEEAQWISRENLSVIMMHEYRSNPELLVQAVRLLPENIFLTVDVDAFDWSVIFTTGTPEPGGFAWDEAMTLLQMIFSMKNVVGFDIVELGYSSTDRNSPFAAAKLIYKMIGFKFEAWRQKTNRTWPQKPSGPLF
jgi:agmatinase